MDAIIIRTTLGEDRRLVIDLPPDTPVGPLEVTIRPATEPDLTKEDAKRRLRAAGLLREAFEFGAPVEPVSDEEIERIGQMKPGARPSEELIAEGRGRE